MTKPSSATPSSATQCSVPRFRSFLPDGKGGWREASGKEDMRQINLRLIRAALGLPPPSRHSAETTQRPAGAAQKAAGAGTAFECAPAKEASRG